MRYDNTGKVIGQFGNCTKYFLSRDGKGVAFYSDSVLVITIDGKTVVTRNVGMSSVKEAKFSEDSKLLAILSNTKLEVISLADGALVWVYRLDDSSFQFFNFDADSSFTYFICGADNTVDKSEKRNTQGKVILLNSSGRLLWQQNLAYRDWSVRYPEVKIDLTSRVFSILTADKLIFYSF